MFLIWVLLGLAWCIGFGCIIAFCLPSHDESFVGASMKSAEFWHVSKQNQDVICTNLTTSVQIFFTLKPTNHPNVYSVLANHCLYVPGVLFGFFHENDCIVTMKHTLNDDSSNNTEKTYGTYLFYKDEFPYCPIRMIKNNHVTLYLQEHISSEFQQETNHVICTNTLDATQWIVDHKIETQGILIATNIWLSQKQMFLFF